MKCDKRWTHQNVHPDCDAEPQDMIECRAFEQAAPIDWINVVLAIVVELLVYLVLFTASPWLLLVPLVWWFKSSLAAESQLRVRDEILFKFKEAGKRGAK